MTEMLGGAELTPAAAAVLSPAVWRRALAAAGEIAATDFTATGLPDRWDPDFAMRELGHRGGRDGLPFFQGKVKMASRRWIAMAQTGTKVRASGRGGGTVRMRVSVPVPSIVGRQTRQTFAKVTAKERQRAARIIAITMRRILQRGMTRPEIAAMASAQSRRMGIAAAIALKAAEAKLVAMAAAKGRR